MANTLIYHHFDDQLHGMTLEMLGIEGFRFTVYQDGVQTNLVLTNNQAADLSAAIESNNIV